MKLSDFGLSKAKITDEELTWTFCGSPAYFSPEMLNKSGVSKKADIYGIGCILYEMLVGYYPYYSEDIDKTLKKIERGKLRFPKYIDKPAKNLIKRLLNRNPGMRPSIEDIENHEYFEGVNWDTLLNGNLEVNLIKPCN